MEASAPTSVSEAKSTPLLRTGASQLRLLFKRSLAQEKDVPVLAQEMDPLESLEVETVLSQILGEHSRVFRPQLAKISLTWRQERAPRQRNI